MSILKPFIRAIEDIRQHIAIYCLTTIVVTLNILILVFFLLIYWNLHCLASKFGSRLGIVAYLETDVKEGKIPEIYKELLSIPGVEAAEYVSSEDAFKRLESYLGDEKSVLEGVDPAFLPPSFEIKVKKALFQPERLRAISKKIQGISGVSKVQYGKDWVQKLEVLANLTRNVVVVSGLLLLFTAAFVVSTTIRLNVYSRQEEIEILKLVGATNSFIEGPFLIEAILQGLMGSGLALAILFVATRHLKTIWGGGLYGVKPQFLPIEFTVIIVLSTIILCSIGTHISMKRFLKL